MFRVSFLIYQDGTHSHLLHFVCLETSLKDLIKRLNDKEFYKQIIPNWTHYRYEALPESIDGRGRVAIEKMMIRSFAAVLKNDINKLNISISEYRLVNRK